MEILETDKGKTRRRNGGFATLYFIFALAAVFGLVIYYVGPGAAGSFFRETATTISKTFSDVLGAGNRSKLAAEVDLGEINPTQTQKVETDSKKSASGSAANLVSLPGAGGSTSKSGDIAASGSKDIVVDKDREIAESSTARAENEPQTQTALSAGSSAPVSVCDFNIVSGPTHQIIFNEIAWMGSPLQAGETASAAAKREWIEIKNNSGGDLNLRGMQITDESGNFKIVFGDEKFPSGALYLLERGSDNSVPGISADKIYTGTLSNSGMALKFFGRDCALFDEVNAAEGWPAGDNSTKHTMSRNPYDLGWYTSGAPGGTPKAANNDALFAVSSPPQQAPAPTNQEQTLATTTATTTVAATATTTANKGKVVISEIMAGLDSNSSYEFVELYNPTEAPINLAGWELRRRTSSGSEDNLVDNGKFVGIIPARGYFLIASPAYSGTPNPDIRYSVTSANIAYKNNSIVLYDGDYKTASVIDEVSWTEIPENQSYERSPLDSSQFVIQPNPNPQNSGY